MAWVASVSKSTSMVHSLAGAGYVRRDRRRVSVKLKVAAAASALMCAFGTLGLTTLTTASSAQTTPGLTTTCVTSNCLVQNTTGIVGGQTVNLTTTVNKFVNQHGALLANVTTTGTINGAAINPITQNVPVTSLAAGGSCSILSLTLGPLHLNLLGLVVDLNQVNLNITGQTGPGNLLGNLLCGLANALNGSQAGGLANLLNNLLAGL